MILSEFPLMPREPFFYAVEDNPVAEQHVLFGEGPDPLTVIDDMPDVQERQLAQLCLSSRRAISRYLQKRKHLFEGLPWIMHLSASGVRGFCGFASSCLSYCLQRNPELHADIRLIYHQSAEIFPDDASGRHMFVVVVIGDRSFIVDLTIRQFLNPGLRLRKDEASVFDALLKYGFVELTDQTLSIYRRFLTSVHLHGHLEQGNGYQQENFGAREWMLSLHELAPLPLENLKRATAENDFEDKELLEFVAFRSHQLVRACSLPIINSSDAIHPQKSYSKIRRVKYLRNHTVYKPPL